ncbi:MAG TPA: proline dehydrogenase family protein [Bacillota bacterium]|nr:proline dehydrogenase family protein [Bacillota bacterium]
MPSSAEALMRRVILAATQNSAVSTFVRQHGMRMGAARFVAGEDLDACMAVLRRLDARGLYTNTTLLGEGVNDPAAARAVVASYQGLLDRIQREGVRTNVALKLTHLGATLGEDLARANLKELLAHAAGLGNFIRIDMEQSGLVDVTLRIYRRLREQGHDNVGCVLQAYLYRSEQDLRDILPLQPNLRIVKGAYLEPPEIAYPLKADVDRAYLRLAEAALLGGGHTCIATHDERIINHVIAFTAERGIARDRFEFQMLYGVRPQYQLDLVRRGHKVLVATPFGPEWYYFFMRRLAERPANLFFVARNWFRR